MRYSAYQSDRPSRCAARWRGSSRQAAWDSGESNTISEHPFAVVGGERLEVDEPRHRPGSGLHLGRFRLVALVLVAQT